MKSSKAESWNPRHAYCNLPQENKAPVLVQANACDAPVAIPITSHLRRGMGTGHTHPSFSFYFRF